ncbi:MAG: hypothetical protein U0790_03205 [Isosphaeraceae bacterium]
MEHLESRTLLTQLDLTYAGASGEIGGALFKQFSAPSSGSGSTSSFVRISANRPVVKGYNTDYRPVQFDENSSASFTRALRLDGVPTVIAPGGIR